MYVKKIWIHLNNICTVFSIVQIVTYTNTIIMPIIVITILILCSIFKKRLNSS